jgi:hypothetical protein
MNGLDGWVPDQYYRVVLAMITAAVVALVLTIFAAVAQPPGNSTRAVASDRVDYLAQDLQPKAVLIVTPEYW